MSTPHDETQDPQHDKPARERERYTETITRDAQDEDARATPGAVENDLGTVIDPDGNVQAPLEDDGA